VTCPATDQCHTAGTCIAGVGTCTNPSKANGTSCDDSNGCTNTDVCTGGSCIGTNITCNDNKACTVDTCLSSSAYPGCVYTPLAINTSCSDGLACTYNEVCDGTSAVNSCRNGLAVNCDDNNLCTADSCSEVTGGCVHTPITSTGSPKSPTCDDHVACTGNVWMPDYCNAGVCVGGGTKDADMDGYMDAACTTNPIKDCDDNVDSIHPNATESCDNVDQDCDAQTDEGCDDDNDGYCQSDMTINNAVVVATCLGGGGDCNDADANINPGAVETLEPTRQGPYTTQHWEFGVAEKMVFRGRLVGSRLWTASSADDFSASAVNPYRKRTVIGTKLLTDTYWAYTTPLVIDNDATLLDFGVTGGTDNTVHLLTKRTNSYGSTELHEYSAPIQNNYQLRTWTKTMVNANALAGSARVTTHSDGSTRAFYWLSQHWAYARKPAGGSWTLTTLTSSTNSFGAVLGLDTAVASDGTDRVVVAGTNSSGSYVLRYMKNSAADSTTFASSTSGDAAGDFDSGAQMTSPVLLFSPSGVEHLLYFKKNAGGTAYVLKHWKRTGGAGAWTSVTVGVTMGPWPTSPWPNMQVVGNGNAAASYGLRLYSTAVVNSYAFGTATYAEAADSWSVVSNAGPTSDPNYSMLVPLYDGSGPSVVMPEQQRTWSTATSTWSVSARLPTYSSAQAVARESAGIGDIIAIADGTQNSANTLSRFTYWGDAVGQTTITRPAVAGTGSAMDVSSNPFNGSVFLIKSLQNMMYWPGANSAATPPIYTASPIFSPLAQYQPFSVPMADGRFAVFGEWLNGSNTPHMGYVSWTTANWTSWTGGTSVAPYWGYVGPTTGYNRQVAGIPTSDAGALAIFECGSAGLRWRTFDTVYASHGALGNVNSVLSTLDCTALWARHDFGTGANHVFAILNNKLIDFYDAGPGTSWAGSQVLDVTTGSVWSVSPSVRGSPSVLVDGTLYDKHDGTWATAELTSSGWYDGSNAPAPYDHWRLAGFDDKVSGSTRWGTMPLGLFSKAGDFVSSPWGDESFSFRPDNTLDQNCNGY